MEDCRVEAIADTTFKSLLGFNNINCKRMEKGNFFLGLKRKGIEMVE